MKNWKKTAAALILGMTVSVVSALAENDHAAFITGPLESGPQVTKTCVKCHDKQTTDFMKTAHWNWTLEQTVHGQKVKRGKANAINNFCTAVAGSEIFCATCHTGYGMTDINTYDFTDKSGVDCLVCHDTTGTYVKSPGTGGLPAKNVDLLRVAQNVGKPVRDNCGVCHFFGGGGDAVKHGDLDSSLSYPDKKTDVHMDTDGNDFACQACHETSNHQIPGNSLGVSPGGKNHFGCEKCHEGTIHKESRLNQHTASIACQTCHIPYFAKNIPTKMSWDWSTAGQDRPEDKHSYLKKKGSFTYEKMVEPEYAWYKDGASDVNLTGEKMDPTKVTKLAYPTSTIKDKDAKITPFKVHRGKQIYDKKNKVFITARVYGEDGYWGSFDWDKAAKLGMEANPIMREKGITYSGEYGFAPTEMYWKLNHMVSPKEDALKCLDCHGDNSRMKWKELGYGADPMSNQKASFRK